MIQIRAGVFETNSSSTHSLCIMTQDDFNKWVYSHNGEYYFVDGDGYPMMKEQDDLEEKSKE